MSALRARSSQRALVLTAAFALVALTGVAGATPAHAAPASSTKTVTAAAYDSDVADSPFPDLSVSVSQTSDLIQQGVTVSWTGAKQSTVPNQQTGGQNFLQIMQCWGDEPGSNGTRPDRTTCQYGGLNLPGDMRWSTRSAAAVIAPEDTQYTAVGADYFDPTITAIPFRSATGVTVASVVDGARVPNAPNLDTNQFFTSYTTNEVSWAGSGGDGSGTLSFELQTAQESPGLGCGAAITATDGTVSGASCWLVVIPRGTADPSLTSITKPGLFWETWKHHVAIKLGFRPGGVRCAIGAAERQLSGSELILGAISQWQPTLCNNAGGAIYSLLTGPETDAAVAANGTATAPLALTSRGLATTGVTDSLEYAPVALTGISLSFAIDRQSRVIGAAVPAAVLAKERQAFTTLKITPRLLAKLLTASYTDALPTGADVSHVSTIRNITQDPDFLAINDPEWSYMYITGAGVGDALVPLGRSDAAVAVWNYILADPAAAAWLNGEADNVRAGDKGNSGMKVNPYYSTNASVNPTGTALSLPAQNFPKADPIEYKGTASNSYADNVNLVTWRPYTASLQQGAYRVLTGDPQGLGGWEPSSTPPAYGKAGRSLIGLQAVIGLTDTSAASQFQVVQASLLNPAGQYVSPTSASLSAAAAAMIPDPNQKQVVGFDPTSAAAKAATAAYPLAMPVYAAVNPTMTDAAVRSDYANFISYAATSGQTVGTGDGQLPEGFAPIPTAWKTQAVAAAAVIKSGVMPTASASPSAAASTAAAQATTASTTAAVAQTVTGATSAPSTGSVTDPSATGATAPALTSGTTGEDPSIGPIAAVVPVSAAAALAAALAIPPLTRRRRL